MYNKLYSLLDLGDGQRDFKYGCSNFKIIDNNNKSCKVTSVCMSVRTSVISFKDYRLKEHKVIELLWGFLRKDLFLEVCFCFKAHNTSPISE